MAQAQTLTGTLRDGATNEVLPFATVRLLRAEGADSSLVQGTQTAESGTFRFEGLAAGAYALRVTVIGYRPLRRAVSVGPTETALGELRLAPVAKQLGQVNITAEKALVQDDLNKRVINVSKDLTSIAGTAVDVLQNIPSVQVDQTGAVSLRGAENVLILIDGKQSGLASGAAALAQIPAARIDRIEVVTNPSARYDADGAGGVINIILKKDTQVGTTGTAALNVGTRDKWNGTGTVGHRRGAWNPTASYDYRRERRWGESDIAQNTTPPQGGASISARQLNDNANTSTTHTGRAGVEWSPAPDRAIGLAVQPRLSATDSREAMLTDRRRLEAGIDTDAGSFSRQNATDGWNRSVDVTADFRRSFAGAPAAAPMPADSGRRAAAPAAPRELSGSVVVTPTRNHSDLTAFQRFNSISYGGLPNPYRQQQVQDTRQLISAARLDYLVPAAGWLGRLETGVKSTLRRFDLDNRFATFEETAQAFVPDNARSNRFAYDEWVQAAYATVQRPIGPSGWTAQVGARAEYTATRGEQRTTGQTFRREYLNLFPSATLARDLGPNQRVQFAYARRVNRPDVNSLNPFYDISDPLNIRTGNPQLRPEFLTTLEAGHQWFKGRATVGTTLFWRRTVNQVQRFRTVDVDGVATMTFLNLGSGTTTGAELTLNTPLAKWWRIGANASAFHQALDGRLEGTLINNSGWVSSARVNSTFQPLARTEVQLTGVWRGPAVTAQGERLAIYFMEAAVSQKVLPGDRGTISLRLSDVFDTQQFRVSADAGTFNSKFRFKRETRIVWVGFAYRFGQTDGAERGPRGRKRGPADNEGGQTGGGEG